MLTFWMSVMGTLAVALICWMELRKPVHSEPAHSLDCRDFYRRGLVDPDCHAPHPSNWFCPTETETP